MFEKATENDISAVVKIYDKIIEKELRGECTTGWLKGIYPTKATADAAIARDDLFVCRDENGKIIASAVINKVQVDSYAEGDWIYDAPDDKVMVIHTLTVDPDAGGKGVGRSFVAFYERYAAEHGCTVLRMDTNERNTVARTLYGKLGYREAGIVHGDFCGIPNIGLVLLEKKVPELTL